MTEQTTADGRHVRVGEHTMRPTLIKDQDVRSANLSTGDERIVASTLKRGAIRAGHDGDLIRTVNRFVRESSAYGAPTITERRLRHTHVVTIRMVCCYFGDARQPSSASHGECGVLWGHGKRRQCETGTNSPKDALHEGSGPVRFRRYGCLIGGWPILRCASTGCHLGVSGDRRPSLERTQPIIVIRALTVPAASPTSSQSP